MTHRVTFPPRTPLSSSFSGQSVMSMVEIDREGAQAKDSGTVAYSTCSAGYAKWEPKRLPPGGFNQMLRLFCKVSPVAAAHWFEGSDILFAQFVSVKAVPVHQGDKAGFFGHPGLEKLEIFFA